MILVNRALLIETEKLCSELDKYAKFIEVKGIIVDEEEATESECYYSYAYISVSVVNCKSDIALKVISNTLALRGLTLTVYSNKRGRVTRT